MPELLSPMSAISLVPLRGGDLRADEIDLEVAQQRLRDDRLKRRGHRRIEIRQRVAGIGTAVVQPTL